MPDKKSYSGKISLLIIVAALGYFVDIYDLLLFGVVRKESLDEILKLQFHVSGDALATMNLYFGKVLLNWQMGGMLIGGIFWGIIGDKKGRLSVLFGSIILYSVANILNGMVTTTTAYSLLRFISGLGLAGELGAGITLVSEAMSKENRGWGTMIVATVGVFGAVVAGYMGNVIHSWKLAETVGGAWRLSFYIGGAMGVVLLLLRIGVYESGLFNGLKHEKVKRGNFLILFQRKELLKKYLSVIFVTVPVWYFIGTLVFFSPELSVELGLPNGAISAGSAVMYAYMGITFGDLSSGFISQMIRSRKKTLAIYLIMTTLAISLYFLIGGMSVTMFYAVVIFGGVGTGYWAVFMSTTAESFGTNIRATATTTAPNFVRASTIMISGLLSLVALAFPSKLTSAAITGGIILAIGFVALYHIKETFGKDLDYSEE
ncbi:MFS transporter [soil metagenome]